MCIVSVSRFYFSFIIVTVEEFKADIIHKHIHCSDPNNGSSSDALRTMAVFCNVYVCALSLSQHIASGWMDVWDSVQCNCYMSEWNVTDYFVNWSSFVTEIWLTERETIKQCNKVVKTCLVLILAKKKERIFGWLTGSWNWMQCLFGFSREHKR